MIEIDSAASCASQGKLTHIMYFPPPLPQTGLSI